MKWILGRYKQIWGSYVYSQQWTTRNRLHMISLNFWWFSCDCHHGSNCSRTAGISFESIEVLTEDSLPWVLERDVCMKEQCLNLCKEIHTFLFSGQITVEENHKQEKRRWRWQIGGELESKWPGMQIIFKANLWSGIKRSNNFQNKLVIWQKRGDDKNFESWWSETIFLWVSVFLILFSLKAKK